MHFEVHSIVDSESNRIHHWVPTIMFRPRTRVPGSRRLFSVQVYWSVHLFRSFLQHSRLTFRCTWSATCARELTKETKTRRPRSKTTTARNTWKWSGGLLTSLSDSFAVTCTQTHFGSSTTNTVSNKPVRKSLLPKITVVQSFWRVTCAAFFKVMINSLSLYRGEYLTLRYSFSR